MGRGKGSGTFGKMPQRKDLNYTPRQLDILGGDVPLEKIRTTELSVLLHKALAREDEFAAEIAQCLFLQKTDPREYFPQISVEEAREILQRLTPWKLDY